MPTREELAAFTTSCWDTIFLFIMGSTVIQPPSDRVVSLLTRGEFMVVHEYGSLARTSRTHAHAHTHARTQGGPVVTPRRQGQIRRAAVRERRGQYGKNTG